MGWQGWIAALGGLVAIIAKYVVALGDLFLVEIGAIVAIIFGIWAAVTK